MMASRLGNVIYIFFTGLGLIWMAELLSNGVSLKTDWQFYMPALVLWLVGVAFLYVLGGTIWTYCQSEMGIKVDEFLERAKRHFPK